MISNLVIYFQKGWLIGRNGVIGCHILIWRNVRWQFQLLIGNDRWHQVQNILVVLIIIDAHSRLTFIVYLFWFICLTLVFQNTVITRTSLIFLKLRLSLLLWWIFFSFHILLVTLLLNCLHLNQMLLQLLSFHCLRSNHSIYLFSLRSKLATKVANELHRFNNFSSFQQSHFFIRTDFDI